MLVCLFVAIAMLIKAVSGGLTNYLSQPSGTS
jgi:ActR/RegA family two-component response regulator